ncbi:MAG: hypothetical protein WA434_17125, partial [Candidatus Acidiferrales bacterium]
TRVMTSMKIRSKRPGAKAPVEWLLIEGLSSASLGAGKPHASTLLTAGLKPCRSTTMPAAGLEPRRSTTVTAERLKLCASVTSLLERFPVEIDE